LGTDTNRDVQLAGDLLLITKLSGEIVSVLEANELPVETCRNLVGQDLADVFDAADASRLKKTVGRALRARSMQTEQFETENTVRELLCVPQGRDRALLILRDVSALRQKLDRVETLAYRDDVTGLPNRQSLLAELDRVLEWQRLQEGRLAVIAIDIERFENDGRTPFEGRDNRVIKELATRLVTQLRGANDIAEDDIERYSVVARTNYLQFAVILPNIESGEDTESVATRLIESLQAPLSTGGGKIRMGAAAGIALYPQDGTAAEHLFANASTAAQDARHSAHTPYRFHTGTVRLRALQRQDIAANLRSALERGEFTLSYQPIVDAATGEIHSAEALLRWPAELFGKRTTQKIITMAEYTGLIVDVGEWVLENSLTELKAWREATGKDLRMAVNLSTREFANPLLLATIERLLSGTGIEPDRLDLEVRENVLFRDGLNGFATSRSLAELGVGLVADDFGTGSSSLAQLVESPLTGLKIDRAFVSGVGSNDTDRAACSAAIGIARSLGRAVTAVGVETGEQSDYLCEAGCQYLQGYLIAEPLSAADMFDYLSAAATDVDEAQAS
jgi:diguanylate cyclase (GGDEF)-like protein